MKITHVVWDWNGTLLDDLELCVETINTILDENNLRTIDRGEYREKFCFPITRYYQNVGLDISGNNFDELSREFIRRYQPKSKECGLVPDSEKVLGLIREKGVVQVILSASRKDLLESQVRDAGIRDYFQELLGLGDIHARSKKEVGLEWQERQGVRGDHILVIGDTWHDYEVARSLGARFLYFSGGHQTIEDDEISPANSISDLREAAAYIDRINDSIGDSGSKEDS